MVIIRFCGEARKNGEPPSLADFVLKILKGIREGGQWEVFAGNFGKLRAAFFYLLKGFAEIVLLLRGQGDFPGLVPFKVFTGPGACICDGFHLQGHFGAPDG